MKWLASKSLQTQLIISSAIGISVMALAAAVVIGISWLHAGSAASPLHVEALETVTLRFLTTLIIAGLASVAVTALIVRTLMKPLHRLGQDVYDASVSDREIAPASDATISWELSGLRESFNRLVGRVQTIERENVAAEAALADRRRTVEHMLEFSQTIQGAGKPDQIFAALAYSLRTELGLAGLVILSHDSNGIPNTTVKASFPESAMASDCPIADLNSSACPCLRQNLPKCFRSDASPIRCGVDASLNLSPDHAAFCIPFTVGGRTQVLTHMLLPLGEKWNDERRQLAQTYVNAAHSSLIALHMLAEAEMQSMTDPLTQLYNRRSMDQLMDREVALSVRHGHPLSIVMIDMDKFKTINDDHGHAAGDHMLKQFADTLRITLRKTDMAFRYGGDEFVIALPQTGIAQAMQVVGKLRQGFAAIDFTDAIANLEYQPTLSIGVAERSKSAGVLTLPQLLNAADSALYDAKASSRNCIRVYQPPMAA